MTDTLYILMRSDLASMTEGRAAAQAAHAANAFAQQAQEEGSITYEVWSKSTDQGFGTTIVVYVDKTTMYTLVKSAQSLDMLADVVCDPTYPLRDGETTHFIPVDTCGYVFCDRSVVDNYVVDALRSQSLTRL